MSDDPEKPLAAGERLLVDDPTEQAAQQRRRRFWRILALLLLGYVNEFGATSQTDLADHLAIGRAAIGSVVDQLQARGLIERQPKPVDRRVWLVAITDDGKALANQVNDVDQVLRAELRHGLGREERQALAWVMTRLQQNLTSAIAKTPTPTPPER